MNKKRLDSLLVERGLAGTRSKAQALVMAGSVLVEGRVALKPGTMVAEASSISLTQPPPFVGRGGVKLESALEHFRLDVSGLTAADIGASTGGFVDCLLKRGACRVYAVDVGRGQLDYRLRQDARVVVMEGVNARYPLPLPEKVDLATIDVSFISLQKVVPSVMDIVKPGSYLLLLFKPQFEARREEVGRGGLVKDPFLHAVLLGRFISWLVGQKARLKGVVPSPILGASGNREFFFLVRLASDHA